MRLTASALVIAGLLSGHVANAQCTRPTDASGFEVTGLKTRLMVTALTCQSDAKYNEFVTRYKPELTNEDRNLNGYFSRVHGRTAAKSRDVYVTELANNESQLGQRQGSLFCRHNLPIFDEVMALHGGSELASYAAAKAVEQPLGACDGSVAATTTRTTTTRRRR